MKKLIQKVMILMALSFAFLFVLNIEKASAMGMDIGVYTTSIASDIWDVIAEVGTGMVDFVVATITGISAVFWDPTLNTGAGGLTVPGTLALLGLGMSLVMVGFGFLKGLIGA